MKKANAWIVSSTDRGRKKIYRGKETGDRKVYLNNGDQFEIELHNPTKLTVLAKIEMDGKPISDSGVIVKPGQRIYLERFLDEDKSFLFETYDVDNTEESKDAISNNGRINVKFYNESLPTYRSNLTFPNITIMDGSWGYNNTTQPWFLSGNNYGQVYGQAISATFDASINHLNELTGLSMENPLSKRSKKSMETGQVSKGEKTGQNFKTVDMEFDSYTSSQVSYLLIPESRKPLSKKDIYKNKFNEYNDYTFNGKGLSDIIIDIVDNSTVESLFKRDKTVESLFKKDKTFDHRTESEKIDELYKSLNQLKELRASNLITKEEFEERKNRIMDSTK